MTDDSNKNKRDFGKENETIFYWVKIVIGICLLIPFLMSQPWRERGCFLNENYYLSLEFKGKVKEKYIDKKNHSYQMVRFEDEKNVSIMHKYYSKIEIGDSICKLKNSFDLLIVKSNSKLVLDYRMICNEE